MLPLITFLNASPCLVPSILRLFSGLRLAISHVGWSGFEGSCFLSRFRLPLAAWASALANVGPYSFRGSSFEVSDFLVLTGGFVNFVSTTWLLSLLPTVT